MHHTNNNNITFKTTTKVSRLALHWQWPLLLFTWAIIIVYLTPQLTQRPRKAMCIQLVPKWQFTTNSHLIISTFPCSTSTGITFHFAMRSILAHYHLPLLQSRLKSTQEFNLRLLNIKLVIISSFLYSWTLQNISFIIFEFKEQHSLQNIIMLWGDQWRTINIPQIIC